MTSGASQRKPSLPVQQVALQPLRNRSEAICCHTHLSALSSPSGRAGARGTAGAPSPAQLGFPPGTRPCPESLPGSDARPWLPPPSAPRPQRGGHAPASEAGTLESPRSERIQAPFCRPLSALPLREAFSDPPAPPGRPPSSLSVFLPCSLFSSAPTGFPQGTSAPGHGDWVWSPLCPQHEEQCWAPHRKQRVLSNEERIVS